MPNAKAAMAPGFRIFLRSARNDQTMYAILIADCVHVAACSYAACRCARVIISRRELSRVKRVGHVSDKTAMFSEACSRNSS